MTLSPHMAFLIFNFLGLQVTWAACAYGATQATPSLGVTVGIVYILAHMIFTSTRKQDLTLMFGLSTIGIFLDHANTYFGILSFPNSNVDFTLIPLWLMVLWLVFSLMIPHSLNWLRNNIWLAFFLGGLGGSSSYWLGHKLGALNLSEPLTLSIIVYFIQWAILLPIAYTLLMIIRRNLHPDDSTQ